MGRYGVWVLGLEGWGPRVWGGVGLIRSFKGFGGDGDADYGVEKHQFHSLHW